MNTVRMWAVILNESEIRGTYYSEREAECYASRLAWLSFTPSDRFTVKPCTVTLEEKEKGE